MKKIYYSLADYGSQEIIKVNEVLKKNSLTLMNGKNVKIFEKKVAGLFGKKYGVMVNSGSSANLLALASLEFKKGSEIIRMLNNLVKDKNFYEGFCKYISTYDGKAATIDEFVDKILIGTTSWLVDESLSSKENKNSFIHLTNHVANHFKVNILGLASGYRFNDSNQKVLRDYEIGYVKEGVGAGAL